MSDTHWHFFGKESASETFCELPPNLSNSNGQHFPKYHVNSSIELYLCHEVVDDTVGEDMSARLAENGKKMIGSDPQRSVNEFDSFMEK